MVRRMGMQDAVEHSLSTHKGHDEMKVPSLNALTQTGKSSTFNCVGADLAMEGFNCPRLSWSAGRSLGRPVGWSAGWVGESVGRSAGQPAGRSAGRSFSGSVNQRVG